MSALMSAPIAQRSGFEETPKVGSGADQVASPKAAKGSEFFYEALSTWYTRNHAASDKNADASTYPCTEQSQACAALVQEVFRPHEPKKDATNGEVAFLPRLLDRVSSSMWSQSPEKNINGEIQSLRGAQSAAAKLLEEIEKETERINESLQEKMQQARLQRNKGFFGLACTNCGPDEDSNEITFQVVDARADGAVEIRPVLRNRVKECEEALFERDAELRQLRAEIRLLQREKDAVRQAEKDAILDRPVNAKTVTVQRYAASLSFVDGSHAKIAFLTWRQHVQGRALKEKLMKSATMAFTNDSARHMSLVFASWRTLAHAKHDAQKVKQERQRLTIGQTYAAKFAMQADSTTLRAIVIEWWRISKETALQAHITKRQAKQEADAKDRVATMLQAQKQGGAAADKACCALM